MYFDQYFIKPAFATLTSLLRTYPAFTSRLPFIYLRVGFSESRIRLPYFSPVSIFFICLPRHPPPGLFLPFLSVGSAKVGIFFELPNKIIFIFSAHSCFLFTISIRRISSAPIPSGTGCKGNNLFAPRKLYFKINPAPSPPLYAFQAIALSFRAGCKSRKNYNTRKAFVSNSNAFQAN